MKANIYSSSLSVSVSRMIKKVGYFLICLFTFFFGFDAGAQTYYWIGGQSMASTSDGLYIDATAGVWSTSLGGASAGAITPTSAMTFIFDGSDISNAAGLQTGAITAKIFADPIAMGRLILQNGANVTIIAGQSTSNLNVGTTGSTASLSGDDILINSGCSLTIGSAAKRQIMTLVHTSHSTTRNTFRNDGTLIISSGSSRTLNLSSAWWHVNTGLIDVYGTLNISTSGVNLTKLENSGILKIQNGASILSQATYNNLINSGSGVFEIVDNPTTVSTSLIISYTAGAKLRYSGSANRTMGLEWPSGTHPPDLSGPNSYSFYTINATSGNTGATSSGTALREISVGSIITDYSDNTTIGTVASTSGTGITFSAPAGKSLNGVYGKYTAPQIVEIDKGAGTLTMAANRTILGTLTLTSGYLALSTFNLTVSGSISGGNASSFVNTNGTGRLIQPVSSSKTFPVGNGSDYMPVSFTAATALNYRVGIKSPSTALPAENILTKVWDISAVSGSPTTIAPQFTWNSTVDNGVDAANKLYKYNGSSWSDQAGTFVSRPAQYQANYSGVSCCSEFSPSKCSTPAAPSGSASQSFCSASSPTISSLATTGTNIKWYDAASEGSVLSAATALANGTTYYATQTVDGGCESSDRLTVTVTLSANLSAVNLSPSGAQTICISGSGSQLSASETGGGSITGRQWGWRSTSGGSITSIDGQTDATYTPSATDINSNTPGTYYIVCTSAPTCGSATISSEVTVTIASDLSVVSLSPSTQQNFNVSGTGSQLTASETGGGTITSRQWGWRSTSGGSITSIGGQTGSTYTPAATDLNSNSAGTYYVVCTSTPTCGSAAVSDEVMVVVSSGCTNVGIASATANASPICSSATTTLTANGVVGTNAVVTWYSQTGGGGTNFGTGTTLNNAAPGQYFARVTGDCGTPVEESVTVNAKTNVSITSATAAVNPVCSGNTTSITASGVAGTNASLTWYTGSGGTGSNLGSSNPLTNRGAGTYYAYVTGDCGSPAEASVTITSTANLSAVSLSPSTQQNINVSGTGNQLTASETGGGSITGRQWGWRSTSGGSITSIGGQTGSSYTPAATDLNSNTAGTYYVVCTSTPTCGSAIVSSEVIVVVSAGGGGGAKTWNGSLSVAWDVPGNWTPSGVPSSTDDVTIPNVMNDPVMSTNGSAKDITLQPGATLQINNGFVLSIAGNFTGNGNIISGAGTVLFNGNSAQTISGVTTWPILKVNNNTGVSVSSGIQTISLGLLLQSGTFTTGGNVTLASNSSNTAYIDDFSSGFSGTISGNVTCKRYFSGSKGYRYISSPINSEANLQVTAFSADIAGQNNYVYNPSTPPPPGSFPTCWIYNEANTSTNAGIGWISKTSGPIETMRGYAAILNAPQTISLTGPVNTGNQSINVTYTSSGNANADGYNLVGNPYPSPIGWNAVRSAINSGTTYIAGNVKRWASSSSYSGQYADWNGTTGTNGGTNNIAIGQAFFIQTTTNCASCPFALTNAVRVAESNTTFFEEASAPAENSLLRLKISTSKGADEAVVYFDQAASDEYDDQFDAPKMLAFEPGLPNIFTKNNDGNFSINVLGEFNSEKTVPLEIVAGTSDLHKIEVLELINFDAYDEVYLEDRLNGTFQNLREEKELTLNLEKGPCSDRCFLHFSKNGITGISSIKKSRTYFSIQPNPATDVLNIKFKQGFTPQNMQITDALGRVVDTPISNTISVSHLPNGIYHVAVTSNEGRFVLPFVVAH